MNTSLARGRRLRYSLRTAVLLAAATATCLLLALLGGRFHLRWDLTATRDFSLSQRTIRAVERLREPTTIVVSADLASIDRAARERITDLLRELQQRSANIRSAWIDTGSAEGPQQLSTLLDSLALPHQQAIKEQAAELTELAEAAPKAAEQFARLSDDLKILSSAVASRASDEGFPLLDQAGLVRTLAQKLEPLSDSLRAAAEHRVTGVALPAADTARDAADAPLTDASRAAEAIAEYARKLLESGSSSSSVDAARTLLGRAVAARDELARLRARVLGLRPLAPLALARTLQAASAVLVATATDAVALDLASMFPPGGGEVSDPAEAVFTGEQLLGTALSSLTDRPQPLAIFVHAQTVRLLDDRGEPTRPALAAFAKLFERLRLTRTTPVEWPVALEPERPSLSPIDPNSKRPVVWIVLGAPPRVGLDPRRPDAASERAGRIAKLAAAVETLLRAGENVMLSIEPSDLPSLGEPDPLVATLAPLGVRADTARPILRRESSPQGALTHTIQLVRPRAGEHAVSKAAAGLLVVLPWATTLEPVAAEGLTHHPLLTLESTDQTWGESQWMLLRDMVARGAARPLAPLRITDAPTPDSARDLRFEASDPLPTLALAVERARGPSIPTPSRAAVTGPQRAMIVASPAWFDDGYTQASENVAGRRSMLFPGNLELFEAGVSWLAGLDDDIAPGPHARDIARVGPIDRSTLTLLRFVLVLGLPALVLILGAMLRIVRG